MRLEDARVSIVGLGLIGGSLALGLRERCSRLVGIDSSRAARLWAAERAGLDEVTADLADGLSGCDLALLAVPVNSILKILERLGHDLPSPRFVLDVGSTKRRIVESMNRLPQGIHAVAGHPLGGKETSGPSGAEAALFRGRLFALVPTERTSPEAMDLSQQVVAALGAESWITDAVDHDRRVACTGQLPFVLAVSLMAVGARRAGTDNGLWDAAASGFLGTSRLAASGVPMMRDILLTNREQVLEAVRDAKDWLGDFADRLANQDVVWIETQLSEQRNLRRSLVAPPATIERAHENHDLWPGA